MLLLPAAIGIATIPMVSELASLDTNRALRVSIKTTRMVALVLLSPTVSLMALSYWLVPLLFGVQYSQAVIPLQLLAIVAYILSVGQTIGSYLIGTGRMWQNLGLNFSWFLVFLPLAYFSGRHGGANGLACAYVGAYVFLLLAMVLYYWLSIRVSLKPFLIPMLAVTCLAALTMLLLSTIKGEGLRIFVALALCSASVAATYAIATKEEKNLVYDQLKKMFLRR
jgi:O-antigen/teichoic acid export membrane protein